MYSLEVLVVVEICQNVIMKIIVKNCLILIICFAIFIGCKRDDASQDGNLPQSAGLRGKWQSSGDNVAVLLATMYQIDSIFFDFKVDNTYIVKQWDVNGALSGQFSGIYTQARSIVGNIWNIRLEQKQPYALISEGIFEIYGETMKLEIVQTFPDMQLVPPTAQGGFGSTNGGALGTTNVQTYLKVN